MNPRLIAIAGQYTGSTFVIAEQLSIGRDEANQIPVSGRSVSRRHCTITAVDGEYKLTDLESKNGTSVNGIPIRERNLKEGDRIEIGESVFIFVSQEDKDDRSVFQDESLSAIPTLRLRLEDVVYLEPEKLLTSVPLTRRVASVFIVIFCCYAAAQSAWTPPKGTYSLAISYQNNFSDRHSFGDGRDYLVVNGQKITDNGSVRDQAAYIDFGYAFTDKLAIGVDIPYITAKYDKPATVPVGPKGPLSTFGPHYFWESGQAFPGSLPIDNGQYHGGIQDLGFKLRYNVATSPFMITPFIQYGVPSHAYAFYSHSTYGNRVAEFQIGTFLGGFVTTNMYLSGGYGLGFPQRIMDVSRTHHHLELESGYFLNEKIKVFGLLHGQVTHGGIDLNQDPNSYNTAPLVFEGMGIPAQFAELGKGGYTSADQVFFHHLQIQRDSFLNITVGTEYSFNPTTSVYGALEHTLTNRNLHILKYGLTFGVSWGFGGKAQRPCHC